MRVPTALIILEALPWGALGFGYTQSDGNTRLVGSSFGISGLNKTFDYVVCIPPRLLLWSLAAMPLFCLAQLYESLPDDRLSDSWKRPSSSAND